MSGYLSTWEVVQLCAAIERAQTIDELALIEKAQDGRTSGLGGQSVARRLEEKLQALCKQGARP